MIKLFYNFLKGILLFFLIIVTITFGSYYWIAFSTKNKIYSSVKNIPHRKVGLVLGTSKELANGYQNSYFTHRINAAAELYHANKIDYLIVSGDNSTHNYNESQDMKLDLVEKGIPSNKIFEDFAGFRTLDSVVRAKTIFSQDSIIIISQKFHNQRAIFLANHHSIDAIGYNAKDVGRSARKTMKIRETFAQVKAIIDVVLGKKPKFRGDKITIS